MKNSFRKRFKLTKKGKLIRRKMGQSHFRAKKSGKQIRGKRESLSLSKTNAKIFKRYL